MLWNTTRNISSMTLANRYSQKKTQDVTTHDSVSVKICEAAKGRSQDSAGEQVLYYIPSNCREEQTRWQE